jgi:hypothetical protein
VPHIVAFGKSGGLSLYSFAQGICLTAPGRQLGAFFSFTIAVRHGDGLVFLDVNLAVDGHSCAGGDESPDDDVFFEPAQVVDSAGWLR